MSITDFFAGCWGSRLSASGRTSALGWVSGSEPARQPLGLRVSEWAGAGEVQVNGPVFRNVERTGKLNTALGFDGEKTRSESLSDSGVDRG